MCFHIVFAKGVPMPQPFTLKHERSPDFRSGVADGAVVSIVGDQLGARVTITFTRMDAIAAARSTRCD